MKLYSVQFYIIILDDLRCTHTVMKSLSCYTLTIKDLKSFIAFQRKRYEDNEIPYWYYIKES